MEQRLSLLEVLHENFLAVYHQSGKVIMELENDPFVVGFVQADLMYSKIQPVCKDKNAYAFAKCVGDYIKQGKCLPVMYDEEYYLAYETDCPEN